MSICPVADFLRSANARSIFIPFLKPVVLIVFQVFVIHGHLSWDITDVQERGTRDGHKRRDWLFSGNALIYGW
jgi:hypothetical protein